MSFQINYELDALTIRNLEHIAHSDGLLQVLRMNPAWAKILEERAGISEAVSSIGVEGTVLTLQQAHAITVGDSSVRVGEKEKREFRAYSESLTLIRSLTGEPLTVKTLLRLHGIVTQGDRSSNPGKFRHDSRSVRRGGKIVYTAPPYIQLDFLIQEFIDWFNGATNDGSLSPVIAGAICHFWFVWIHPFADGNGRMARLLTTFLLLKKQSEGVRYFALSDHYNKNLDDYYDALAKTNRCKPLEPSMNFSAPTSRWVSYFVASYRTQMQSANEVANRILQFQIRCEHLRNEGLISEQHEKVLSYLSRCEKASYKELQELLGNVTAARITQILKPLRDARVLMEETVGKRKWFKLGAPENEPDEMLLKRKLKVKAVHKSAPRPTKQAVLPIFDNEV